LTNGGFDGRVGFPRRADRHRPAIMRRVSDPFADLEPQPFWRHFEALTRIPRATFEEERASAHVVAWAEGRGYATRRDAAGNLVVAVPATPGREGAPTVILQGHLDMVCEREPDSPYDPREGRIRVVRDGEWLRADGTTLGADDGVAIAAMLALAEDPDAEHGPLELLMTVEEEVGLAGAINLDPALLSGSALLNLDSEEDATLTVGCAGGVDATLRLDLPREPATGPLLRVTVGGGLGGHSGGDIALGRANAIKALARALRAAPGVRIVSFDGGASRNAIPRDATALVLAGDPARAAIEAAAAAIEDELHATDPGVRITVDAAVQPATDAWTEPGSARILDLVEALPTGPLAMSQDFPGVVETSSSVGVAETDRTTFTLRSLTRSADDAAKAGVTESIAAAARLAGAELELAGAYPGWRPDLSSPLLATATRVHEALFNAPPHVTATHGGLETALIGAKRPELDMLSFGPRIEGAHAPGERLHAGSAARFMRLLNALLDELSR
jgi:dipeptidase D